MHITNVFAGIAVADFDAARAWYERLVGRPADLVPNDNEVAWRLTDTGWFYVVGDADRAGNALLTILVAGLEEFVAGVVERGIAVGPIETVPGVVRTATLSDPEGNKLTFGEPLAE